MSLQNVHGNRPAIRILEAAKHPALFGIVIKDFELRARLAIRQIIRTEE
ncbi:MAG TPA: hypothetical protein VIS99_17095 [Terrimicrobiaceae bacterium]